MRNWPGYQKGVNLGGWFSQCDHTAERYDRFITAEDFPRIKAWGADHVRVPVDYELLEDRDGTEREDGYRRLRETVTLCRENGLHMILDLHKTAGFSFDDNEGEAGFFESEAYQERFYRLWESIARRFGQDADILAFELLNEVTEKEYAETWNRISRECIRRIREIAPETYILVGGYYHNSAVAVKDLAVPCDDRIVYNFHCYEPLIFTHQGANWIPTMDPAFRIPVTATFAELEKASGQMLGERCNGFEPFSPEETLSQAYFEAFFAEAAAVAEARDVPLYCGEYGVIDRVDPKQVLAWYRMIHGVFEKYGIGRAAWSYREMDFGLSDSRMDDVREQLIELL